jgi:methyl coenzyme M reductase gamma subunit
MNQQDPSHSDSGDFTMTFPRVTPHMVRSRTVELAIRAGRTPIEIRQRDYEQARRELTGETDFDRQHAVLYPGQ